MPAARCMRDAMFTTDESMGERRVAGITAGWQAHDRMSEAEHMYVQLIF